MPKVDDTYSKQRKGEDAKPNGAHKVQPKKKNKDMYLSQQVCEDLFMYYH